MPNVDASLWARLRELSPARIGLGRSGCAQPTRALLGFQEDHARARDAVHASLAVDQMVQALGPWPCVRVNSRARDRGEYLRRPDLGRRLTEPSAIRLQADASGNWDLVFVLADGLSANAASDHGPTFVRLCIREMPGLKIAPVVIAEQARVALGDEVAQCVGADAVAILIGERPGLTVAESLGFYYTWRPSTGTPDSLRNCISNVHPRGLPLAAAVQKAVWLVREASRLRLSGVALKEDAGAAIGGPRPLTTLPRPEAETSLT